MPISQERELDIERQVAAIMRELDRCSSVEKPRPRKPKQLDRHPWAPPLLLDQDE
jgi:hypothetical protein